MKMKKIFLFAVFAVAFSAFATDEYFYWMIGENATLDGEAFTEDTYYAKVKIEGASTYLNLYANPGGTAYDYARIDLTYALPLFAGTFSSASGFGNIIVELYNDGGSAPGSWVGQATLAYDPNSVTGGGMSVATAKPVTAFTAAPEPTSGMLLLLGVAGLALRRKNKKA